MADWRAKAEALAERQIAKRKREEGEGEKKIKKRFDRERAKILAGHQKKFKCHVCGKPSSGPTIYESTDIGEYNYVERWDRPAGLSECDICHQWTCEDHIHNVDLKDNWIKKICQKCAERL